MSQAAVQLADEGVLSLSGVLDYRTGPALRKEGQALIKASKAQALVLDCAGVEKSSSVGLSLLLGFTRDAQAAGKAVEVRGLPQCMLEIAEVYDLDELLGLVQPAA